jgi:iron complex transport system ATP-binding protein
MNQTPVLQVAGLRVERGGTAILRDLNWQVRRGEHWLIIGPNGCGKTTLLSVLTGYVPPTAGQIDVLGQRQGEYDWRELRRQVGLVSSSVRQMMADDEPALESVVSGKYAMIDYWGEITAADRKQATQILKEVECLPLAERPWLVLSQGERQRILIGRALMAEPDLLILDEPCAGLDPVAREHFLGFINRLAQKSSSPTLLMVTHHVEEITPSFTHALLLRKGEVVAAGEAGQTLTVPHLATTFGTPLELVKNGDRYQLRILSAGQNVM